MFDKSTRSKQVCQLLLSLKNQQVELDQRALIAGPDPHENFKRADYKKRND